MRLIDEGTGEVLVLKNEKQDGASSDNSDLLPCPFCGGEAKIGADHDRIYVYCKGGCRALGPRSIYTRKAVEAWNTRCR